ncbi:MAG: hypothetical protein WBA28_01430 [Microbacteriaceae bacterium]
MNSMTADGIATTDSMNERELNAFDRCDSCGAQAYVRVVLSTGELLFCAHHGNAHKEKLMSLAQHWQDDSQKLLEKN